MKSSSTNIYPPGGTDSITDIFSDSVQNDVYLRDNLVI